MSRIKLVICCLLLAGLAGCARQQEQPQSQPPAQEPAAQPAPAAPAQTAATPAESPAAAPAGVKGKSTPAKETAGRRQEQPSPPAATTARAAASTPSTSPPPRIEVIPAGTALSIRLTDPLDTGTNKAGDTFKGVLDDDLVADGMVVAPRGSSVTGRIANLVQSGRVQGRAQLSIALRSIDIRGVEYPIQTNTVSFEAESTKKKDAAKVGIGAGIGAAIGAIAGGGKGAAIGAAVGGGAGGATVLATRGNEIKLAPEHQLKFTLRNDVRVTQR
jgi:hypothetical protein